MIPLERGVMDDSTIRTWPGSPRKKAVPGFADSTPRYTAVERSAREIGYREGERKGTRFGFYWGLVTGIAIGGCAAGVAIVGTLMYRYGVHWW